MGKCRLYYLSNGIANGPSFCCKQCLKAPNDLDMLFLKTLKKIIARARPKKLFFRILTEKASLHCVSLTIKMFEYINGS